MSIQTLPNTFNLRVKCWCGNISRYVGLSKHVFAISRKACKAGSITRVHNGWCLYEAPARCLFPSAHVAPQQHGSQVHNFSAPKQKAKYDRNQCPKHSRVISCALGKLNPCVFLFIYRFSINFGNLLSHKITSNFFTMTKISFHNIRKCVCIYIYIYIYVPINLCQRIACPLYYSLSCII